MPDTRRNFFNTAAAISAGLTGATVLPAQERPSGPPPQGRPAGLRGANLQNSDQRSVNGPERIAAARGCLNNGGVF